MDVHVGESLDVEGEARDSPEQPADQESVDGSQREAVQSVAVLRNQDAKAVVMAIRRVTLIH